MRQCLICYVIGLTALGLGLLVAGLTLGAGDTGHTTPAILGSLGSVILLAEAVIAGAWLSWPRR